jgi:hypothetical protein
MCWWETFAFFETKNLLEGPIEAGYKIMYDERLEKLIINYA